jgi:hypothetical protein
MAIAEFKISLSLIGTIVNKIKNIVPTIKNLAFRPKAIIEFKTQRVIVKNSGGIESHISYPCILISFTKDVKINVGSIKINNESLSYLLSTDDNFLRQNERSKDPHTITNNRIMPFVSKNWKNLTQRKCWYPIERLEQEVFPICIGTNKHSFLFNKIKKPHVFFSGKNLVLSLDIDGDDYQYCVPTIDVCKVIVENLISNKPPARIESE